MKPLALALLTLLVTSIVSAQDVVPWPPDTFTIFAPGVDVVSAELTELPPYPVEPSATPMPANRCGGDFPFQWQAWVFDSSENPTHLCNTLTGALSPLLPDGYMWNVGEMGTLLPTPTSPDGKWVVFLGQTDSYDQATILAYDTGAKTFQVIGDFTRQMYLRFGEWINNQIVLLDTYNAGNVYLYDHFIYVIDLHYQTITKYGNDQANSLDYYPDPPRLITRTGSIYDLHCTKTTYLIETRQIEAEDYGAFCQPEYRDLTTGATYYRILPRTGGADIVRYDPETKEQVTIYHGAIERIDWISPDEHLAILTLDNRDGNFGEAVSPLSGSRSDDYYFAHLALVDLTTRKEIYLTPAEWNGWPGYWAPFIRRYPENWFFISTEHGDRERLGPNRLIHVEESGAVIIRLMEVGNLDSPLGGGWAFMKNGAEKDWKVDLYHFDTGETVRLVEVPDQYYVEVEPLHDDLFQVTVGPLYYTDVRRAIYVVRVAGVDIPESP